MSNLLTEYVEASEKYHDVRSQVKALGAGEIKKLRQGAQLTMREFAAKLGVSLSYVAAVETGRQTMPPELAKKILEKTE